jgi:hypothetical protein
MIVLRQPPKYTAVEGHKQYFGATTPLVSVLQALSPPPPHLRICFLPPLGTGLSLQLPPPHIHSCLTSFYFAHCRWEPCQLRTPVSTNCPLRFRFGLYTDLSSSELPRIAAPDRCTAGGEVTTKIQKRSRNLDVGKKSYIASRARITT